MKKLPVFILATALWAACAGSGHASLLRSDYSALEGPVLAKKESTRQITVRNSSTGEQKTFTAEAGQLSSVKVGDTVLILHPIDSNVVGTMVVTQPK